MFEALKHAAGQDRFIRFLSDALDAQNIDGIKNLVNTVILNKDTSRNIKIAFYEAEKMLVNAFIAKKEVNKVKTLIEAINSNNDKKLIEYECKLLLMSVKEQRNILYNNIHQAKELKSFLDLQLNKLDEPNKISMATQIEEHFKDIIEVSALGEGSE